MREDRKSWTESEVCFYGLTLNLTLYVLFKILLDTSMTKGICIQGSGQTPWMQTPLAMWPVMLAGRPTPKTSFACGNNNALWRIQRRGTRTRTPFSPEILLFTFSFGLNFSQNNTLLLWKKNTVCSRGRGEYLWSRGWICPGGCGYVQGVGYDTSGFSTVPFWEILDPPLILVCYFFLFIIIDFRIQKDYYANKKVLE